MADQSMSPRHFAIADSIRSRRNEPIGTDRITVDDLLRMRSGIPAPNDDQVLARVYAILFRRLHRSPTSSAGLRG